MILSQTRPKSFYEIVNSSLVYPSGPHLLSSLNPYLLPFQHLQPHAKPDFPPTHFLHATWCLTSHIHRYILLESNYTYARASFLVLHGTWVPQCPSPRISIVLAMDPALRLTAGNSGSIRVFNEEVFSIDFTITIQASLARWFFDETTPRSLPRSNMKVTIALLLAAATMVMAQDTVVATVSCQPHGDHWWEIWFH